jgi:hypothetical protein
MDETKVSLKDMIAALRTELAGAQAEGKDEPLRFEIESSEIEVKVSVTREAKAKGGVKFWVINAGVEGKEAQETSLTVKLKLNVFDDKVEPASKKKARISGRG